MDRRTFLKLVGATTAATVIKPAELCKVAGEPERFVGEYALALDGATKVRFRQLSMSPLILPAPPGRPCRAVVYPGPVPTEGLVAYVTGVLSGNDPGQVVIENVQSQDGLRYLLAELDANVLNAPLPGCPVDWGAVTDERHLVIDYSAMGPDHQTLYLALVHTFHDDKRTYG